MTDAQQSFARFLGTLLAAKWRQIAEKSELAQEAARDTRGRVEGGVDLSNGRSDADHGFGNGTVTDR
jgi:hypothetical protein